MEQDLDKEFGSLSGISSVNIRLGRLEKKLDRFMEEFKKK